MDLFNLYLIALLPGILIPGCYFLLKKFTKLSDKFYKIFLIVLSTLTMFAVAMMTFHIDCAMFPSNNNADQIAKGAEAGGFQPGVGNWELVGIPYGTNKFLNFLALFICVGFLPCSIIAVLYVFYRSTVVKNIIRYITAPLLLIEAIFMFVYIACWTNITTLDYRNVLIAISFGLNIALTAIVFIDDLLSDIKNKVSFKLKWKSIVYFIVFFLTIYVASLPAHTFAVLINTHQPMFGNYGASYRIDDFQFMHRIFIYLAVILPISIYFIHRNKDYNLRKLLLLGISLAVLANFVQCEGAYSWFSRVDGVLKLNVKSLPIHLCHTALFVIPICIAFNLKRLFYFTYFINVFGAIAAMLWPDSGTEVIFTSVSVAHFWSNHIAAATMPLLCVALGLFEKPKMKQMLYSMMFFTMYFVIILALNGWLSNYVDGYDPEKVGSGTDYFFINGTYVLDIISDNAYHLMDFKVSWTWGSFKFVYYPLYQSLFLVGYFGIMFAELFIYSLFFRISDSHRELHDKLVVARLQHISLKEKLHMEKVDNIVIDHNEASLKFIDFSKRYGNSKRLSADHVNLEVKGGEIFGFLGPNGAGKSTCIKSAIGIQPVTDGRIEICGYDVTTQSVYSKKVTGYVPDHYALYEKLTGREYINYIADLYGVSKEDRDVRIAKYVDLFELTQAFDNRMQTYSHGMKQKMTIMAALVHEPKLWILDEPLTGLDPQSIYQVKECMKEHAAKGNIVFFSSHIIDVVEKMCTRIAIIKKGQIVYQNTMEGVEKDHPEGLEEFYMSTIRDNGDLDE